MTRLDDAARVRLGGSFVRLTEGQTHYRIEGPAAGSQMVLIHGATVPHWEFDRLAPLLHRHGIRTLRFDLYGHGYSDRPRCRYDLDLFIAQAAELMAVTGFAERPRLLGHSLGAAIAAGVVGRDGLTFSDLTLLAPLLDFSQRNPLAGLLRTPVVGELFMRVVGLPALRRRRRRRYQAIGLPALSERFNEQARLRGFWRALLSMERHGAFAPGESVYRALARRQLPLQVIWGRRDHIIPEADIRRLRACLPQHAFHALDGLEHNLMLSAPERVAALIVGAA